MQKRFYPEPMVNYKLRINRKHSDWAVYKNEVSAHFSDWDCGSFRTINEAWSLWKSIVNYVGSDVIGFKSIKGNSQYNTIQYNTMLLFKVSFKNKTLAIG